MSLWEGGKRECCRVASPEERSGLLGLGVQLERCSVSHCHFRVVLKPWASGSCRGCGAGAALPVRFGQLIPSKVLKELHTMVEPPIFTLGGCGGALAWPEATQNSQALLSVLPLPPGSAQLGFPGAGVAQNEA